MFKGEKRTINYADDDDKSDSGTEYDKADVLGSQIVSKRKKKEYFQKEWFKKSNWHKNKSKSPEVFDTSVANSNSLSVNNALDGLSSNTNCLGADIYIAWC